jgi:hypothetical protein
MLLQLAMLAAVAMYLSRRSLGTVKPPGGHIEPMQEKPLAVPKLPDGVGNDLKKALKYAKRQRDAMVATALDSMGDTGPLI